MDHHIATLASAGCAPELSVTSSKGSTWARSVCPLVLVLALSVTGCATSPNPNDHVAVQTYAEANDPLEPFNRTMFDFGNFLDRLIVKPVATMYDGAVPGPARKGIHNALNNLRTPIILANDVLQGEFDQAGITLARFGINTTVGVAGLMDPATKLGYPRHDDDFGITLAVHGVQEGPYLYLPFVGPAPPRDLIGKIVDAFFDPMTYVGGTAPTVQYVVNGIDMRANNIQTLDQIQRSSIDFYATIRSLYRQQRAHDIAKDLKRPDSTPTTSGLLRSGMGAEAQPEHIP